MRKISLIVLMLVILAFVQNVGASAKMDGKNWTEINSITDPLGFFYLKSDLVGLPCFNCSIPFTNITNRNHAALNNLTWSTSGHTIDTDLNMNFYPIYNISEIKPYTSGEFGLYELFDPTFISFIDHQLALDTNVFQIEPTLVSSFKDLDMNGHNILNSPSLNAKLNISTYNGNFPNTSISTINQTINPYSVNSSNLTGTIPSSRYGNDYRNKSIPFALSNGTNVLATGYKAVVISDYSGTVTMGRIRSPASGNLNVTLSKSNYSNYPATWTTLCTLVLSSSTKLNDVSACNGQTVIADDNIQLVVNSADITNATVQLTIQIS